MKFINSRKPKLVFGSFVFLLFFGPFTHSFAQELIEDRVEDSHLDGENQQDWRARMRERRREYYELLGPIERWKYYRYGIRASVPLGLTTLPAFQLYPAERTTVSVFHVGPYIGFDVGYVLQNIGVSVTFDGSPLVLTRADAGSIARHFTAGISFQYYLDRFDRLTFGFEPWTYYYFAFPTGQSMQLNGIGVRVGMHRRLKYQWGGFTEVFADLLLSRFTLVNAGYSGNYMAYAVTDYSGNELFVGTILLQVGFQINWVKHVGDSKY